MPVTQQKVVISDLPTHHDCLCHYIDKCPGKEYYSKNDILNEGIQGRHMRKIKRTIPFILFFVFVFLSSVHAGEGEGTTVSCYIANPPSYDYIGELEVFNLSEAASSCNTTYEDCQGNCIGCYIDEDSLEVCIDKSGNEFERE